MFESITAYFYKQMKITVKVPGEIAWILVYPMISIFSLGILTFFVITRGSSVDTMLFILVGVIVWDVYAAAERSTSFGLVLDIWNNSLKHTFTGISSFLGFVIGSMLFAVFSVISISLIMGILAFVFFGFNLLNAGLLLANLFSVFIFAASIGFLVNALMLTKGEKFMSLIWIVPGIIMLFSGIYYPIDILPGPVQAISLTVPSTHSLISLRAGFGFSPELAIPEFLIGLGLSAAYFSVSVIIMKWAMYRTKVNGIATRF
jgi:ABC-2 type transport system permease protein